uniref:Malectin-like domain-containing protein n=2 Tax=Kalanchoe fedtschenkoi TaxID=63787 RepID=A0A7N0TWI0_KALFE
MGEERRISKLVLGLALAYFLATTTIHVQAQDQSGFVSIDCGSTKAYTDEVTGIKYVPDTNYIDSGQSKNIAASYNGGSLETHLGTVRSFPDGVRNCYTIRHNVNTVNGTRFLIRARFMYGNYDSMNQVPEFDLYMGVNLWTSVKLDNASSVTTVEMIYVTRLKVMSVCLVNKGSGTAFISALETRILDDDAYGIEYNGYLNLVTRANMAPGSEKTYRFPDDIYDRIWAPKEWSNGVRYISTNETININNMYDPPQSVMNTAVIASTSFGIVDQSFDTDEDSSQQYYTYMHLSELQKLAQNQTREFNIYLDSNYFYKGPFQPHYLSVTSLYSLNIHSTTRYNFSITASENSTLPPMLNAYEIYTYNQMPQLATNEQDIEAMRAIKSSYGGGKIWQGDPCAPQDYSWEGLACSFKEFDPPKIIGLNLSSSNLKGQISASISDLKSLESLDLSNNNSL